MSQANRYTTLIALTKRADTIDPAYHAAFYLLSYDKELFEIASRFINVDGIGFTGLKRATRGFDERSRYVIDIAHNLFSYNSPCKATPFEISRLGYPYMELVCNAFYIATEQAVVVLEQGKDGQPQMTLNDDNYKKTKRIHHQFAAMQASFMADAQREDDDMER